MLHIEVLTPEGKVFSGNILSVTVPGSKGRFEVLNNHAPLLSSLNKGKVSIVKENKEEYKFDISGGFFEILNNQIALLAENVYEIE
jgi:F-type H+-transporting ATPase subunit epsilon